MRPYIRCKSSGLRAAIIATLVLGSIGTGWAQSKADSGWVPLFNGRDFEGFYAHYYQYGVVEMAKQEAFRIDSGIIHVPRAKPTANWAGQAHLFTRKRYSWYRVRVEYRYAPDHSGGSQNAGLIVHVENDDALIRNTKDRRPTSIEINMRRADGSPWTLWSASNLGPYINTTVRPGTQLYLAASEGGVPWTNDPWAGDKRVVYSAAANTEKPMGQWNQGEARIYGDSLGEFYLNGALRTRGWNFRVRASANDADPSRRIPYEDGGIGLQSEDHEIWYRNWEIMELEPHTRRPINAKPTTALALPSAPARGEGRVRLVRGARSARGGSSGVEAIRAGSAGAGEAHDLSGRNLPVTH